jgi:hypothetical protein
VCALYRNTIGSYNTALGPFSLCGNTTGASNVGVGVSALLANTVGANNTAIGPSALRCNTTGQINVAVGTAVLYSNTIGVCNTAIGTGALSNTTTGNCHTAVGRYAQNALNANVNNTIAVGVSSATSATTGHTVWGNSGNNVCNCVYAAWSTVSDCRDKVNIKSLPNNLGLQFIKKLKPVSFNWDNRETYVRECKYEYGAKDGTLAGTKEHYGVIAQDLKSVLDELEVRFDGLGHDDEKDAYRVTYEELIAPIIKAIQEQQEQIEVLQTEVEKLKNR